MPMLISDITPLMAREDNQIVTNEATLQSQTFAAMEKRKATGKNFVVNIDLPTNASVTSVLDLGRKSQPVSDAPVQGAAPMKFVYGAMTFSEGTLLGLNGVDDSVDIIEKKMSDMGKQFGRRVGRALFGPELAAGLGIAGGSIVWGLDVVGGVPTATIRFTNCGSEFREGESYHYLPTNFAAAGAASAAQAIQSVTATPSVARGFTVRCTKITRGAALGQIDVTFKQDVVVEIAGVVQAQIPLGNSVGNVVANGQTTIASATDRFFLRGALRTGTGLAGGSNGLEGGTGAVGSGNFNAVAEIDGLQKICSETDSLYGLASGQLGWQGYTRDSFGVVSAYPLAAFQADVSRLSDSGPDTLICGRAAAPAIAAGQLTPGTGNYAPQARRNVDAKIGLFPKGIFDGSAISVNGAQLIADHNCPDGELYLVNMKNFAMAEWSKIEPIKQSGDVMLVMPRDMGYEVQYRYSGNTVTTSRKDHARAKGVTLT